MTPFSAGRDNNGAWDGTATARKMPNELDPLARQWRLISCSGKPKQATASQRTAAIATATATCNTCNRGRRIVQSRQLLWPHVADVAACSCDVAAVQNVIQSCGYEQQQHAAFAACKLHNRRGVRVRQRLRIEDCMWADARCSPLEGRSTSNLQQSTFDTRRGALKIYF